MTAREAMAAREARREATMEEKEIGHGGWRHAGKEGSKNFLPR